VGGGVLVYTWLLLLGEEPSNMLILNNYFWEKIGGVSLRVLSVSGAVCVWVCAVVVSRESAVCGGVVVYGKWLNLRCLR
jgi:hypothetical protein